MSKGRLEAFSDGVLAIIITIMVLEIKVPHGNTLLSLRPLLPVLLSYVLSFINIGIYWNNHHHMFLLVKTINGKVLWCNIHLLFWLSLIPFATGWMGENNFTLWPVVVYGIILLMCGVAYTLLALSLLRTHGKSSIFAEAIGKDVKGKISITIYVLGILLSFVNSLLGLCMYIIVAVIWFIPDRRIEEKIIP